MMRKNWALGFFGFLALLAIPGFFTQDWLDLVWLVWIIWLVYFIPIKQQGGKNGKKKNRK